MSEAYHRQSSDVVSVHPQVIRTIVREAALGVAGVARLGVASGTLDRWMGWEPSEDGVHIHLEGETVRVGLQLVVNAQHNFFDVCLKVQEAVNRTLQTYVGINTQSIDVQIVDIIIGETTHGL